jgi:hypothetical protein
LIDSDWLAAFHLNWCIAFCRVRNLDNIFPDPQRPNPNDDTAKKRIFGSKRRYEETVKLAALAQQAAEPAPLKYAPTYEPPRFLPNGWSAPPPPEARATLPCAQTPFQVERAGPGQWLPVYTDVRKGRTQLVTLVRKVSGDLEVSEFLFFFSLLCASWGSVNRFAAEECCWAGKDRGPGDQTEEIDRDVQRVRYWL